MYRTFAVLMILSLLLPSRLLAEAGWTEAAQILSLEANLHGRILVEMDVKNSPSGCKDKSLFFRESFGEGSANMYRPLLEAASNRQRVKLRVTGQCHLKGYSEISAAVLMP